MLSDEARRTLQDLRNDKHAPRGELAERRAGWEETAAAAPLPEGTEVTRLDAAGVPAEWVAVGKPDASRAILLLHGGGYVSGSCVTHREMAARLSLLTGAPVLVVDYRRAPEHPFPAATDDVLTAYKYLLSTGVEAGRVAVCGDSAGGGLTAALLVQALDEGVKLPAAAVLLSPWLDLQIGSPSAVANAEADPSITREGLCGAGELYVGDADPHNPLASPQYADPTGFPPLYVNVGDVEVLLDDALIFARKAKAAGVDVTLSVGEGLWHVYPAWAASVPEGMAEMQAIAAWLRDRLAL